MSDKTKRELRREKFRRRKLMERWGIRLVIGVVVAGVLGFSGLLLWNSFRPNEGRAVEIMEDFSHVEPGTIVEYNTDPPTSGRHYDQPLPAGFYEEGDISVAFPEGHIVHSLEHGYVVFWYNCDLLNTEGCLALKDQIRTIMDEYNGLKLIAFPRNSIEFPLVVTSWGHMLELDQFDADAIGGFIEANRSRPPAPEPLAP